MCVKADADAKALSIDTDRMLKAMLEVEKQVHGLDDIRKCAHSIRSSADRIEDRARLVSENILRSTKILNEETAAICQLVKSDAAEPSVS